MCIECLISADVCNGETFPNTTQNAQVSCSGFRVKACRVQCKLGYNFPDPDPDRRLTQEYYCTATGWDTIGLKDCEGTY